MICLKKKHIALIAAAILIIAASIGVTAYLLFSNYQNVLLFKQAEANFQQGDPDSLKVAELQLLQVIRNDKDNESAYIMLGEIAEKQKIYPEQVYYCYMAYRLNPLSRENREKYIRSLCLARYFDRLENFLAQLELTDELKPLLLYAAGRNGNISKYKFTVSENNDADRIGRLALLLFGQKKLSVAEKIKSLDAMTADDLFLKQEILAAKAELFLSSQDLKNSEIVLKSAYDLNEFAFAPPLGRFYANFRTFGKALPIFEKYLEIYHDPALAIQTAEIYCLLGKSEKIAELRKRYQLDSGNSGMLCCYYFDALSALEKNDMAALMELTPPLRKSINTPLAAYMFLCTDIQNGDTAAVAASYASLLEHRPYLDLQKRADKMVLSYLKRSLDKARGSEVHLLALAQKLYRREADVFTAKFILLMQKKSGTTDALLLKDALKRFKNDQGIVKIAIEYYLGNGPSECELLIAHYKKTFPAKAGDILRYEIILALKKRDFDRASTLFQKNFSPAIAPEYWTFASSTMREGDLLFLSRDKLYAPFCQALLHLKKREINPACDLLESADAKNNYALLFFAAKTLAENGRNQAALKKYALFPENSPYTIAVLLNMAELHAESGNIDHSLSLSARAYDLAPAMPETQLCYADKLHRKGDWRIIPDIVKLSSAGTYRRKLERLWIAGMEQRIKDCNISTQREKIRELCRQIQVIAPDNGVALEYLKQLHKMPQ
ncbi:MAG: hypothetical protein IJY46_03405 [Lentisphaeria bacterium]|nr:hypothetical protein [Lentisphaeria bacterium]